MIRSSKVSLRFSRDGKLDQLQNFVSEYQRVVSIFIDLLWGMEKIPALLPKPIISQVNTWLSARAIQCAGKQASGIVRGTRKKQRQRLWMIQKLTEDGKFKKARALQKIYDGTSISKPAVDSVKPELDARFIRVELDNATTFDGWVTISSIGNRLKLNIPFKRTKHFNKLFASGEIKAGIRLSKESMTFMFELPECPEKQSGNTVGIDIGQTTLLSCSNGEASHKNNHGHDLSTITTVMSRKKKGSRAFERCVSHRTNYINWSVNQFNFSGIRRINIEGIKHLRRGKRTSRRLSHWVYTDIFDKLESRCAEQGVLVNKVNPTYTSQRCSECAWTCKSNRNGKRFKCGECGHTQDSDLNASRNIALPLRAISPQQRLRQVNRTGFYWLAEGQECIVPAVH
jgi:putative transposase